MLQAIKINLAENIRERGKMKKNPNPVKAMRKHIYPNQMEIKKIRNKIDLNQKKSQRNESEKGDDK